MIRKSKITSLAELRTRKKELSMETELAKREFAHTLGTTRDNMSNFLVKNVALPVGGGLAGLFLLTKLFSGSKKRRPVIHQHQTKVIHEYPKHMRGTKRSRFKKLTALIGVIRVAAPILQTIIGAFQTHKAKEAAQTASRK